MKTGITLEQAKERAKEEWRDIIGYEGKYQVSNIGRVKSLDRYVLCNNRYFKHIKGKILKGVVGTYGYLKVSLCGKNFDIHSLVAGAFVQNPCYYTEINHKDENKLNNRFDNLEYCTKAYNNNYGTRNERLRKTQLNDIKKSKSIIQYSLNNELIKEYPSVREASRQTGINENAIRAVCKKKKHTFTASNFKWKFKNDPTPIEDFPQPFLIIRVKKVHQYSKDGKFIKTYNNAKDAYRETGIHYSSILRCARGIRGIKSAGGFIWRFKNE